MNGAFEIGQTGLVSLQRALDILANNVTNINTQGFKRSDVRFSEIIAGMAVDGPSFSDGSSEPGLAGVSTQARLMLGEQGELQQTGRPLDLAIQGQGFLELMGPRGEVYLWRGGGLAINDDGQLTADNGMILRDAINLPLDATGLEIRRDGMVLAADPDGEAIELGQLSLVQLSNGADAERLDGGLYRVRDGARPLSAQAGEDGAGEFLQGTVERSNVDLNIEMVDMMVVQRAYAANAQIVQAADQLMSIANNLRG
jgi:flagellar basal-body rod protein FlgG